MTGKAAVFLIHFKT